MKTKLMWRKIAIITLILAVGVLLSCELPGFSDKDKEGVVGKTSTGADLIFMDTDIVDSTLVNINPGVSLTFSGLEPEYIPAKGDIINAGPSAAVPDGFFYKVKNVTTNGGETVVEVETATFEEALEEVEFTETFDMAFDDGGELWLAEGVEAEIIYIDAEYEDTEYEDTEYEDAEYKDAEYEDGDSEARSVARTVKIDNKSIAAVKLTINEKVKGVTLTGTVEISQTIYWNIKTEDWELQYFELSTTPRFKADITASVGKDFEKEFKKNIATKNFDRIVFWVGPVCVTLKPQLTLDLVVTAKGEVSLSAKLASWDKSYTFGVQYAKGGKLAGFQKNTSQPTKYLEGLELEMNGEVKAGPKVSFMFGLWDAAYAGMSAGVYSRLEGKASASTSGASASLSLLWGLELGAEAKLEILSKLIAELSVNFFNKEWTIWSKTMSTSAATLQSVSANGSSSASTTQLTLTFDKKITGLSASDISLSALTGGVSVAKGTLSGSGPTYTLAVTVSTTGGTLNVSVNKAGYTISGSPKSVTVYYKAPTAATLQSVSANGNSNTSTTQLTLTFDKAITGLTASDISLSALSGGVSVTKGTLSGSGPTYTLGVTVSTTGGTLNVSVNKAGYAISGSPKSVTVYYKAAAGSTAVTFSNLTQDGSSTRTTTQLTLTFSQAITGLAAADITLSGVAGVQKGNLSASGATYTLPISGFTAGGTLNVSVAKTGYTISGSSKSATIYCVTPPTAVTLQSVSANGSSTETTTQLTLTFSQAITGLAASDITLSWVAGVSKGTLSASGATYTLPISGFSTGGTLNVAVAKTGYTIIDSPKTVAIFHYSTPIADPPRDPISSANGGELIYVPGGSFQMGTASGAEDRERPVHTVTLTGFYMGKYEVTQKQWQEVMGSLPSSLSSSSNTYGKGDNYPVYYVSWYDAIVFCNKLSMAENLSPAYRISGSTNPSDWGTVPTSSNTTWNAAVIVSGSTGYRLPTEAQWEYAAKGGDGSPGNYTYAGSDTVDDVAWYECNSDDNGGSSNRKSHEVGTKAPNGLGLYDMSGNVWEWCWDWYANYTSGDQTDPMGPGTGAYRVPRGGSWVNDAFSARCAYRYYHNPDLRGNHNGFRLVRPGN